MPTATNCCAILPGNEEFAGAIVMDARLGGVRVVGWYELTVPRVVCALTPPVISTSPLGRRVDVCPERAAVSGWVVVKVATVGS